MPQAQIAGAVNLAAHTDRITKLEQTVVSQAQHIEDKHQEVRLLAHNVDEARQQIGAFASAICMLLSEIADHGDPRQVLDAMRAHVTSLGIEDPEAQGRAMIAQIKAGPEAPGS